ncbi:autotransporter assembly complex family protein [Ramlibacter monticola]|uniref:BamA/TamA family outer membrane protein n=1 Tax=Ramlibacter monticola TaxID=1926872 RepID=A0A936YW48_9BURK|nr:BamA/TamA family outer membrane protein [Ramlibacter monticola]MBL0390683.1 BamA/TamA family outer membrane protein [Ramlibacter monticola]
MIRAAALVVLLMLAAATWAQSPPAFDLEVRAPGPLKELLERHLELRRYREVSDLDDAEIARLVVLADQDARELLATQGYFAPQVRIAREPGERTRLVVDVQPGERAVVGEVDIAFEGDIAGSPDADAATQRDTIRRDWELPVGRPFTQPSWEQAKSKALRALLARRYPAGRISYSLADVDAASARAKLGLKLDSGALFRLGPVRVTGIERYDPLLVERLARLPEGAVYDQEKIVQAQLRLAGSGYFDSAFIFVDPLAPDPQAAPVQVTVREAPLQKVILGLGFTTDGGPRATLEHRHNRVPGIGWQAITKLQVEDKNPYAQTEWIGTPDPKGWRKSVLARAERLDDGRLVTYSQRLRAGRFQNSDHIDRNVFLQYERSSVDNPNNVPLTPADTGDGSAVTINYAWTGRYFDNLTSPTRGFGIAVELGAGVTLEGNQHPFQRTVVRWLGFRPLEKGRLQLRAEGGAVLASGSATVPSTQLFRTGGDNTVRGYGFLDIGVPLGDGLVGPGRLMALGSVEWQRPIQRGGRPTEFEGLLFVDAGAVADHVGDLRPRVGVGTGVRWRSPVGPVEMAIAYGVEPRRFHLHFTAGFVF